MADTIFSWPKLTVWMSTMDIRRGADIGELSTVDTFGTQIYVLVRTRTRTYHYSVRVPGTRYEFVPSDG